MLSREDLADVATMFGEAVDLDPASRLALLDTRCGSRADLRAEIDSLFAAHERVDSFLEPPAVDASRAAETGPGTGTVAKASLPSVGS